MAAVADSTPSSVSDTAPSASSEQAASTDPELSAALVPYSSTSSGAMKLLHSPEELQKVCADIFEKADVDKSGRVRRVELEPVLKEFVASFGDGAADALTEEFYDFIFSADEADFEALLHHLLTRVHVSMRTAGKNLHPAMGAMILHSSHFNTADADHNGLISVEEASVALANIATMAGADASTITKEWVTETMAPCAQRMASIVRQAVLRVAYHSSPRLAFDHIEELLAALPSKEGEDKTGGFGIVLGHQAEQAVSATPGVTTTRRRAAVRVRQQLLGHHMPGVPSTEEILASVAPEEEEKDLDAHAAGPASVGDAADMIVAGLQMMQSACHKTSRSSEGK